MRHEVGDAEDTGRGHAELDGGDNISGKRRRSDAEDCGRETGGRNNGNADDDGDGAHEQSAKMVRGVDVGERSADVPARHAADDPADDPPATGGASSTEDHCPSSYPWRLSSGPVLYKEYVDGVWVLKSAGEASFAWQRQDHRAGAAREKAQSDNGGAQ